jgi:hypothetical protein
MQVKLRDQSGLKHFKVKVLNGVDAPPQGVHRVKFDYVRLTVRPRRVLDESEVPVHPVTLLYNTLVRCQVRKLSPLQRCCRARVCGERKVRFLGHAFSCTWRHCGLSLGKVLALILVTLPSFIRLAVFVTSELQILTEKSAMASRLHLRTQPFGTMFVPIHVIFPVAYVIVLVDMAIYCCLDRATQRRLRLVLKDSLQNLQSQSTREVVGLCTLYLVKPCERGLAGTCTFLKRLLQLAFFIPLTIVSRIPLLDLTVRLLFDIVVFLCPDQRLV